jgi:hypothetical protein
MNGLEVLLAVAGLLATVLVVAGMILITPRNDVDLHEGAPASQGDDLSRADAPDRVAAGPSRA